MKINVVLRVGVVFFLVGLSLGIAAIPRSDCQITAGMTLRSIPPYGEVSSSFFFPPRDVRLEIECSHPINFYLFDSEGFEAYNESGILNPIFYFENGSRGMYFISLPKRDIYYMVFRNLLNTTVSFNITMFFYGFEKDLLRMSMIFVVSGIVLIVLGAMDVSRFLLRFRKELMKIQ